MFSTLGSLDALDGARVLDLYAGSGAVGLEAISRGAVHALLIESERTALAVLRSNVETLALPGAQVAAGRVEQVLARRPSQAYDLLFADPPYALAAAELCAVLTQAVAGAWLAPEAVVVLERATRDPAWSWPAGFVPLFARKYGEATLWYSRHDTKATLANDPQPEGPD
jgi:16S rRNA (guanine966-N2)-methyltransferase